MKKVEPKWPSVAVVLHLMQVHHVAKTPGSNPSERADQRSPRDGRSNSFYSSGCIDVGGVETAHRAGVEENSLKRSCVGVVTVLVHAQHVARTPSDKPSIRAGQSGPRGGRSRRSHSSGCVGARDAGEVGRRSSLS